MARYYTGKNVLMAACCFACVVRETALTTRAGEPAWITVAGYIWVAVAFKWLLSCALRTEP